jgi:hypothetical protein
LSGCPSETDSDVNVKRDMLLLKNGKSPLVAGLGFAT